jgi:hypothetical protein
MKMHCPTDKLQGGSLFGALGTLALMRGYDGFEGVFELLSVRGAQRRTQNQDLSRFRQRKTHSPFPPPAHICKPILRKGDRGGSGGA